MVIEAPMPKDKIVETLQEILFADPDLNVFAVLDGASIPDLLEKLDECDPEHFCLYRGELDEDLEAAAPYLVQLEEDSLFTDWLMREGWGNHWGIFATADATLKAMRKHFRTFLMVKDPEGETLYFRYYDPRVFSLYLPTLRARECDTVFGDVAAYYCESEKKGWLAFTEKNGKVAQKSYLQFDSQKIH